MFLSCVQDYTIVFSVLCVFTSAKPSIIEILQGFHEPEIKSQLSVFLKNWF